MTVVHAGTLLVTGTGAHLVELIEVILDWAPSAGSNPLTLAYRERGITPGNRGVRLKRPGYGPQATDLTDMVKRVADLPPAAEPGTAYSYSTIGYAALGLAIERVSGSSLDAYCRDRIFSPLQMTSTAFRVTRDQVVRLTTNYDVTPSGLSITDAAESSAWLEQPTLLDGGGGLISTARDFARFGLMLLNDGRLGDAEVLRPETARLARSNLMPTDIAHEHGYGAGVSVALAGQGKVFQSGIVEGNRSGRRLSADLRWPRLDRLKVNGWDSGR